MNRIRIKRHTAAGDAAPSREIDAAIADGRRLGHDESASQIRDLEAGITTVSREYESLRSTHLEERQCWEARVAALVDEKDGLRAASIETAEEAYQRGKRQAQRDMLESTKRVTPDFVNGWFAMIELVRQHVIVNPSEVEWFENEFCTVLAPDALDVLKERFGS